MKVSRKANRLKRNRRLEVINTKKQAKELAIRIMVDKLNTRTPA